MVPNGKMWMEHRNADSKDIAEKSIELTGTFNIIKSEAFFQEEHNERK
jgi:hypothetical protein